MTEHHLDVAQLEVKHLQETIDGPFIGVTASLEAIVPGQGPLPISVVMAFDKTYTRANSGSFHVYIATGPVIRWNGPTSLDSSLHEFLLNQRGHMKIEFLSYVISALSRGITHLTMVDYADYVMKTTNLLEKMEAAKPTFPGMATGPMPPRSMAEMVSAIPLSKEQLKLCVQAAEKAGKAFGVWALDVLLAAATAATSENAN